MSIHIAVVLGLAIAFTINILVNVYVVRRLVEEKGGATLFAIFTVGLYVTVIDGVYLLVS